METYEDIVRLVFRCINLGIFISLVGYLFKKKVLPLILDKISQNKKAEEDLRLDHEALLVRIKQVEDEIEKQEEDRKLFNEKIKTWEKEFNKTKKNVEMSRKRISEKIEKKAKKREDFLSEVHLRSIILPGAVKGAKKKLSQMFVADKEQEKLLFRIFKFVEKRI